MIEPRRLVNALSLSRIGLGLLFVVSFHKFLASFYVSLAACGIAFATDVLDGYFARRFQVASVRGRHWDSLGDKSFYIAIIVAFNAQGFLDPLVSWGLIVREVALYITRILFIDKLPAIEQIRPWTNWHGYFMYLTTALGLFQMYGNINNLSFSIYPYLQVSACCSLAFGVVSIVHFLKMQ